MTPTDWNSNTAARPLIRPLAGVALALGMVALLTANFSPAVAQDRPNPQRRGVSSPPAPAQATSPAPTTRATTPTKALFDAVARNDMAQVQAALSRGADLNERNSLGMTATEMAVDRGYFEIGHFLLSSRTARPSARPASEASSPAARQPEPPPGATTQAAPVRRVDHLEITPPAPAGPAPALGARPVTAGPNDPFNPEAAPLGSRLPVLDPPRNAPPALLAQGDSQAPKGITSALRNASNGITQPDMGQPDAAQPGAAPAANATPAQQPSAWRRIADWLTPWRKPSEPMGD
ncbi:MAG: hypothetical protein O3A88_02300 [Proteobacteria bacterium]|nr:hypothetical protein [Pseudomonadota bacterium]